MSEKELIHKIKVNEKSRRKMQQSLMKEIERLKKYEKFIDKVIITPVDWNNEDGNYQLHNMSKQDLYKELFELRHQLQHEMYGELKGDSINEC